MNYSIEVHDLSKRYRKGRSLTSLRDMLSFRQTSEEKLYHWAVRDVSFAVKPGEALGIIGPNGAGKTTILKLLSNVTKPTSGAVSVNGRFSALIELGAGFHPDLTGRENIFLNGAILGMKREEIQRRFDEIVDFAGIDDYLDTPVKRYSSGMYARLGFAIAAHIDPDVLLVDEVLAVGDYAFQQKCHARMDKLRENGTSLIFVSHNFNAVNRVCDQGLVMYGGRSVYYGTTVDAIQAYSEIIRTMARNGHMDSWAGTGSSSEATTTPAMEISAVTLLNGHGEKTTIFESGTNMTVIVDVTAHSDVLRPAFSIFVRTSEGVTAYVTTTEWMGLETPSYLAGQTGQVEFQLDLRLVEGSYELGTSAYDLTHFIAYDRIERAAIFRVNGRGHVREPGGIVDLDALVRFTSHQRKEQARG